MIPKTLRTALGLPLGGDVELVERDGTLEITAIPTPMRLVQEGVHVFAVTDREMPVLTDEQVRETLERTRR